MKRIEVAMVVRGERPATPLIHTSPVGLEALQKELEAERPYEVATVVERLYTCRMCSRAREVFRARDNRGTYAHLCRSCFGCQPISHQEDGRYVFVTRPE